jgi:hypothetical protein
MKIKSAAPATVYKGVGCGEGIGIIVASGL